MQVQFSCRCGHRVSAPVEAAGKKGKCPACGLVIVVPFPPGATPEAPGAPSPAPGMAVAPPPMAAAPAVPAAAPRGSVAPSAAWSGAGGAGGRQLTPARGTSPLPSGAVSPPPPSSTGLPTGSSVITVGSPCRSCGRPMAGGAVVCVHCGTNQRTGERITGIASGAAIPALRQSAAEAGGGGGGWKGSLKARLEPLKNNKPLLIGLMVAVVLLIIIYVLKYLKIF